MVARELRISSTDFIGDHVTFLTSQPADHAEDPEHLALENMQEMHTHIQDFTQMMENRTWTVNNDHLRLPQLLIRRDEAQAALTTVRQDGSDATAIKEARYACTRCTTEIMRRISVACSVFSFTLMGLACGIRIGRNPSSRGVITVIVLAAMYLIAFFVATSFDHALLSASLLYLMPHVIICAVSLWMLRRVARGVESCH